MPRRSCGFTSQDKRPQPHFSGPSWAGSRSKLSGSVLGATTIALLFELVATSPWEQNVESRQPAGFLGYFEVPVIFVTAAPPLVYFLNTVEGSVVIRGLFFSLSFSSSLRRADGIVLPEKPRTAFWGGGASILLSSSSSACGRFRACARPRGGYEGQA